MVVLCEPQFKPSIENQAISHAYRMGQTRKGFVHRLLCTDTINERIMQILANEQRIFDTFADRSVAAERVDQAFSRETMDKIVREELRKYADARQGRAACIATDVVQSNLDVRSLLERGPDATS